MTGLSLLTYLSIHMSVSDICLHSFLLFPVRGLLDGRKLSAQEFRLFHSVTEKTVNSVTPIKTSPYIML